MALGGSCRFRGILQNYAKNYEIFWVGGREGLERGFLEEVVSKLGRVITGCGTCGQRQRVAGKENRINRYC